MSMRWIKTRFFTGRLGGIILLLVLIAGIHGVLASPSEFIRVDGRHLSDGNGRRFAVKGINLGNWLVPEGYMFKFKQALAPKEIEGVVESLVGPEQAALFWREFRDVYVGEDDIRFIKAAGFNTVRVPLHWRLFVAPGEGGEDRFEGPGWVLLDRLVQWCRNAGLRVIIDMHAAPGGQTGVNHDDGTGFPLTFYIPRYRELTVALWRALAAHYRDDPTVLGYDLLNEPISPYSDEKFLNPQLEGFYRDIVDAIRSVDGNHLVFLSGAQWGINFDVFGRPFDNNAVYTYHKFWARPTRDAVQSYVNFSYRWNVPILIGETGEADDEWNEKFRRLNERFDIGWCFWTYKNLDSKTSVISIRKPEGWDLIAAAGSGGHGLQPDSATAQSILDAYLEAAKFKNGRVNGSYLESLSLEVPAP
jgi:aryl-phospho-beta-D-glucosidase BglC (GH1 family)